jgi:hypothetical protein
VTDTDCETTRKDFEHALYFFKEAQPKPLCDYQQKPCTGICYYHLLNYALSLLGELQHFGFTEKPLHEAKIRYECLTGEQKWKAMDAAMKTLVDVSKLSDNTEKCVDCEVKTSFYKQL